MKNVHKEQYQNIRWNCTQLWYTTWRCACRKTIPSSHMEHYFYEKAVFSQRV